MPHICPDEINAFIAGLPFLQTIIFHVEHALRRVLGAL